MAILTLEIKKYAIKIDNFEGPLDLLCHLIDKNKMNIYDINLSEITDQYIAYFLVSSVSIAIVFSFLKCSQLLDLYFRFYILFLINIVLFHLVP